MLKNIKLIKNMLSGSTVLCLWQVTGRCDFTCKICTFWKENHTIDEELNLGQIEMVVEKIKPLAPIMISLAGGEPLLREDLHDIVKIVAKDHYCSVITNGWHMTRDIAKKLYENGMRDAMVSIDYAVPERHDAQRGVSGAFERAVAALEILRDTRPDSSHKVRILTVLLDDNIQELEGLLLMAKELSVSLALTLYSDHRGKKAARFPKPPVSEYLLELKRRHAIFDSASEYLASFDQALTQGISGCGGGRTFININCRGMISRCIDTADTASADPQLQSLEDVRVALRAEAGTEDCAKCWTSCRGLADVITGVHGIKNYREFTRSRRSYPV
jgi:MoaA/NifB/PqqE/SkfB family radical SAM enzyme